MNFLYSILICWIKKKFWMNELECNQKPYIATDLRRIVNNPDYLLNEVSFHFSSELWCFCT